MEHAKRGEVGLEEWAYEAQDFDTGDWSFSLAPY